MPANADDKYGCDERDEGDCHERRASAKCLLTVSFIVKRTMFRVRLRIVLQR